MIINQKKKNTYTASLGAVKLLHSLLNDTNFESISFSACLACFLRP